MNVCLYLLCAVLCVCLDLPAHAAGIAESAEKMEEKVYAPDRESPASPVTPVRPVPDQHAPVLVVPGERSPVPAPLPTDPGITEVPALPTTPVIPLIPVIPTLPATPDTKDATRPQEPRIPEKTPPAIIVEEPRPEPPPDTPKEPEQSKPQEAQERILLTPGDFLPKAADKKPEPPKAEVPKAEAPKEPSKPGKGKPETPPAEKPKSEKPLPPPQDKKGQALRIPPEAGKTGNMDFLEGCWRGRLSGRRGNNEVTDNMGSRFCFDKNGKGKHYLDDPKLRETCIGSANGGMKPDGTLRVDFGDLYCPSGDTWYPQGEKYMTCRDEGGQTQCYWYYPGGQRRTTGPFYRE